MIQSGHRELHFCLKHRYVYNCAVGTDGRARNVGLEAHRAETMRCDGALEQGLSGSDSWTNAANSGAPVWSRSSLSVAQYVYIHIYIHLFGYSYIPNMVIRARNIYKTQRPRQGRGHEELPCAMEGQPGSLRRTWAADK